MRHCRQHVPWRWTFSPSSPRARQQHAAIVLVVDQLGIELLDGSAGVLQELGHRRLRQQHVVAGDAGLPRVQELGLHDGFGCGFQICIGKYNNRRLATEFEMHAL